MLEPAFCKRLHRDVNRGGIMKVGKRKAFPSFFERFIYYGRGIYCN